MPEGGERVGWFFPILMLALAGWAAWRIVEAMSFSKLVAEMAGELTNIKVRRFIERLSSRSVPNSPKLWGQLRELERRVAGAGAVTPDIKQEFKSVLDSKGLQY